MLFPTIDFAIFFAVAFSVNWLLNPYPGPWKLAMIGLSYFFYGWVGWHYCLLLVASTAISHFGGVAINRSKNEQSRKYAMVISVGALSGTARLV